MKILFIINPISGYGAAKKFFQKNEFSEILSGHQTDVIISEYRGHATEIAKKAIGNFDVIAGAGGDGTVNEIGKAIINSSANLAIIPFGSGNGLARHCKIPVDPAKAIELITKGKVEKIDAGSLDGNPFFCAAGIGFDAHVGELFSKAGTRGLTTYLKISMQEYFKYHCPTFTIMTENREINVPAFLLSFANANQFGNNAFIAPGASLTDGLLDLCILKPFPVAMAPFLALRLFRGTIEGSHYYNRITAKKFLILRSDTGYAHTDGETFTTTPNVEVECIPGCLNLITGN